MQDSRLDTQTETDRFNRVAADYTDLHAANVKASGEQPAYFAEYKLNRLISLEAASPILDFGCGIGNLTCRMVDTFAEIHGFDPSAESLALAADRLPSVSFHATEADVPDGHFRSAVLSGVLHHIPVAARDVTLNAVRRKLRPGGRVFIFEHNPFNPLTRRAVTDCEFDRDAILLTPGEVRTRLRRAGFRDVRQDFIVFFPRPLEGLRWLEPSLGWCPAGAQTLTIGVA